MSVHELRTELERRRGELARLKRQKDVLIGKITSLTTEMKDHEIALETVKKVGLRTQQQLEYHISELTSLALDSVFPDPHRLVVEFVERRGQTECDLLLEHDTNKAHPEDETGGGVVDVASFALRAAAWSMMRPRSRPLLILDEPFKHLSYSEEAGRMLKEVADRLEIQIVMVSHSPNLIEAADRAYRVTKRKGISKVEQV